MTCGVDIQNIQEFQTQVKSTGDLLLSEIFFPDEIEGLPIDSIVGRFCVKEALVKAGVIDSGDWKKVKLLTEIHGYKPKLVSVSESLVLPAGLDFSISHSGDYAVGMVVVP